MPKKKLFLKHPVSTVMSAPINPKTNKVIKSEATPASGGGRARAKKGIAFSMSYKLFGDPDGTLDPNKDISGQTQNAANRALIKNYTNAVAPGACAIFDLYLDPDLSWSEVTDADISGCNKVIDYYKLVESKIA